MINSIYKRLENIYRDMNELGRRGAENIFILILAPSPTVGILVIPISNFIRVFSLRLERGGLKTQFRRWNCYLYLPTSMALITSLF